MVGIDIGLSTLVVFVSASIALIGQTNVSTSPSVQNYTVDVTGNISGGQRTGLSSALGTSTGILVHTSAAVFGLSALLQTSAIAYTVVKYVGVVYLLYLGIQTIRHEEKFELRADDIDTDNGESYRRGVMVNTLNPKVAIFFLAFLPQFVTPGPSAWLAMLSLGVLYAVLTTLYLGTLALMSSRVTTVLTTHPRVTDVIRWAAGSVIVGFGIELAATDQTPN